MNLSKVEMETIILYNEAEDTANVFTHDNKLIAKLRHLSEKYPNWVFADRQEAHGAVSYIVPKRCICVREPYSEDRRKADRDRAKKAGITPPSRTICPKNE